MRSSLTCFAAEPSKYVLETLAEQDEVVGSYNAKLTSRIGDNHPRASHTSSRVGMRKRFGRAEDHCQHYASVQPWDVCQCRSCVCLSSLPHGLIHMHNTRHARS